MIIENPMEVGSVAFMIVEEEKERESRIRNMICDLLDCTTVEERKAVMRNKYPDLNQLTCKEAEYINDCLARGTMI